MGYNQTALTYSESLFPGLLRSSRYLWMKYDLMVEQEIDSGHVPKEFLRMSFKTFDFSYVLGKQSHSTISYKDFISTTVGVLPTVV